MFYEGVRVAIFRSNSRNEQLSSLSEITFDTYIPMNLPKGYKIQYVKAESDPFWTFSLPSVTINLKSAEEKGEFNLLQFPLRKNFNPPAACGSSGATTQKTEYEPSCVLIGHSTAGCDVYRAEDGNSKSTYSLANDPNEGLSPEQVVERYYTPSFCRIKNTILTLGLKPRLSNEDIVKVYDSLVPITDEGLAQYVE